MKTVLVRVRLLAQSVIVAGLLAGCSTAATPAEVQPTVVSVVQPTAVPAVQPTGAPAPQADAGPQEAGRTALLAFLNALHSGQYAEAVSYYGGDYSTFQLYNPDVAADDHAGLFQRACEVNGFVCLEPGDITFLSSEGDFLLYEITYRNTDGSQFVIKTPGDPAADRATFRMPVQLTPTGALVLSPPVYTS